MPSIRRLRRLLGLTEWRLLGLTERRLLGLTERRYGDAVGDALGDALGEGEGEGGVTSERGIEGGNVIAEYAIVALPCFT